MLVLLRKNFEMKLIIISVLTFLNFALSQDHPLLIRESNVEKFDGINHADIDEIVTEKDYKFYTFDNYNLNFKGELCIITDVTNTYRIGLDGSHDDLLITVYESEGKKLKHLLWQKRLNANLKAIDENFVILSDDPAGMFSLQYINILTGKTIFISGELRDNITIISESYKFYLSTNYDGTIANLNLNQENKVYDRTIQLSSSNQLLQKIHLFKTPDLSHHKQLINFSYNSTNKSIQLAIGEDSFRIPFEEKRMNVNKSIHSNGTNYSLLPAQINYNDSYLTEKRFEDISNKSSKDKLRFLRNEIFARHGYKFSSTDLSNYFNKQSWYHTIKNIRLRIEDFSLEEVNIFKKLIKLE